MASYHNDCDAIRDNRLQFLPPILTAIGQLILSELTAAGLVCGTSKSDWQNDEQIFKLLRIRVNNIATHFLSQSIILHEFGGTIQLTIPINDDKFSFETKQYETADPNLTTDLLTTIRDHYGISPGESR